MKTKLLKRLRRKVEQEVYIYRKGKKYYVRAYYFTFEDGVFHVFQDEPHDWNVTLSLGKDVEIKYHVLCFNTLDKAKPALEKARRCYIFSGVREYRRKLPKIKIK